MRRQFVLALLAVVVIASIAASLALAGGWSFDWGMGSLWASGYVDGVPANEEVEVTLTAQGTAYALCLNPAGHLAPGRNPLSVEFESPDTQVFAADAAGVVNDIFVEAPDPAFGPSPSAKEAGCPNERWTVVGVRSFWDAANITVTDAATGQEVYYDLNFNCVTTYTVLKDGSVVGSVQCEYDSPREEGPF